MKIIQSFWTKPIFNGNPNQHFDRLKGGWIDNTSHLMSWALSCLQLRKFYNDVELITDNLGEEILINKLKLPYTKVNLGLEKLNHFHLDLWALGKIVAYKLQDRPFLHVDSDVYIWKRFSSKIQNAQLVCQNIDSNHIEYHRMLKMMDEESFQVPQFIQDERTKSQSVFACNAGILGGNDLNFFKEYTNLSLNLVKNNHEKLNRLSAPTFNIIFEQFLFYCLATNQNKLVETLFEEIDYGDPPYRYIRWHTTPLRNWYIHMIAGFKKDSNLNEKMRQFLRKEHPEYYYRIIGLKDLRN